jgi:hypothetical protein
LASDASSSLTGRYFSLSNFHRQLSGLKWIHTDLGRSTFFQIHVWKIMFEKKYRNIYIEWERQKIKFEFESELFQFEKIWLVARYRRIWESQNSDCYCKRLFAFCHTKFRKKVLQQGELLRSLIYEYWFCETRA